VNERKIAEAVLLLAEEPVPAGLLGELLEKPTAEVEGLLGALAAEYEAADRGFVLREVAGGWRLYTAPECGPWLERFVLRHRSSRLSSAALEVLAVVAYKGPISRAHIAEIRGVDSDGVVRTLTQRGLIEEIGRQTGPGAPVLFRVTPHFLERMGLRSTEELPPLAGFIPDSEAVEDMEAKLSPNA
jgi:segregation and condensation protein B